MVDVLHLLELVGNDSEAAQAATEAVLKTDRSFRDNSWTPEESLSTLSSYQTNDTDYRCLHCEMLYYLDFAPITPEFSGRFYAIENG